MRWLWGTCGVMALVSCAALKTDPTHHASSTHHWQSFAKTIPAVTMPSAQAAGQVKAYYPIPQPSTKAKRQRVHSGSNVFLPPHDGACDAA